MKQKRKKLFTILESTFVVCVCGAVAFGIAHIGNAKSDGNITNAENYENQQDGFSYDTTAKVLPFYGVEKEFLQDHPTHEDTKEFGIRPLN